MSADNHDMNYSAETYVVAGGRPAHEHDAPVNPPIVLTSTYRGVDAVNIEHDRVYARFSNPTWEGMEEVVAKLENASQPGLLFPSGMAAVSSVIDLVPVGAIVLIPKHAYMASVTLCKDLERRGIIELVRVDIEDTASVIVAMEDAASRAGVTPENVNYSSPKVLAWLESPTNPMLEVGDLPEILAAARRLGVVTAVDNTFATPILQRPLDLGADVVVHSATKFLAGHSDVLLGMTLTSNEELYKAMLHYRITKRRNPRPHGGVAGPARPAYPGAARGACGAERAGAGRASERASPSSRRCATRVLRATAATRSRRSRCPASARFCASRWIPTRREPATWLRR